MHSAVLNTCIKPSVFQIIFIKWCPLIDWLNSTFLRQIHFAQLLSQKVVFYCSAQGCASPPHTPPQLWREIGSLYGVAQRLIT